MIGDEHMMGAASALNHKPQRAPETQMITWAASDLHSSSAYCVYCMCVFLSAEDSAPQLLMMRNPVVDGFLCVSRAAWLASSATTVLDETEHHGVD